MRTLDNVLCGLLLVVAAIACGIVLGATPATAKEPHAFYFQCGEYDMDGKATFHDCGSPIVIPRKAADVVHTPSFPKPADADSAPPGLPDALKLSPEDQQKVDATPAPLAAIAVTNCGMAIALFIQLDADHLFRADPRQSDMFTAVKGKMVQSTAPPMAWNVAYALAEKAVLSSHVVTPCTDGPQV